MLPEQGCVSPLVNRVEIDSRRTARQVNIALRSLALDKSRKQPESGETGLFFI
jgi:hypothetical protein